MPVLRNLRLAAFNPPGVGAAEDDILDENDLAPDSAEVASRKSLPQRPHVSTLIASSSSNDSRAAKPAPSVKFELKSKDSAASTSTGTTSSRKRSARELAQDRVKAARTNEATATDSFEQDLEHLVSESFFRGDSAAYQMASVWLVLAQNLLSHRWEARHGSAAALSAFMTSRTTWPAPCLEDIAVRCLCVLGMDRFGDYAADSVVAPVRESCARLLALAAASAAPQQSAMDHSRRVVETLCNMFSQNELHSDGPSVEAEGVAAEGSSGTVSDTLRDMGTATLWGRRYAALLAAKFLLLRAPSFRRNEGPHMLPRIGSILFQESEANMSVDAGKIVDTAVYNDEIRRAAADVTLVCIWETEDIDPETGRFDPLHAVAVLSRTHESAEKACHALWRLLARLDDVALITSRSVTLLAATSLIACKEYSSGTDAPRVLDMMLSHRNRQVQDTGLQALHLIARHDSSTGACQLTASFGKAQLLVWFRTTLAAALSNDSADNSVDGDFESSNSEQAEVAAKGISPSARVRQSALQVWAILVHGYLDQLAAAEVQGLVDECVSGQHGHGASAAAATALRALLEREDRNEHESRTREYSTSAYLAARVPNLANEDAFVTVLRVVAVTMAFRCDTLREACQTVCDHRDWGQMASSKVRAARSALEAALTFFINCFRSANIDEQIISQYLADREEVGLSTNDAFLESAQRFVASLAQEWLEALPEPTSQEDARLWNESTAAARSHTMQAIRRFSKLLAWSKLRNRAFFQVGRVCALGAGPVQGEVGPYLRPLVPATLDSEFAQFESKILAEGLVTLMGKLADADKTKALGTISKKILAAEWPRQQVLASSLALKYPNGEQLWMLLPELESRLLESSPGALWVCSTFAKRIALPDVLAHLRAGVQSFVGSETGKNGQESSNSSSNSSSSSSDTNGPIHNQGDHDEPVLNQDSEISLLQPLGSLFRALETWGDLAAPSWSIVHEFLLPVACDTSRDAKYRVRALSLLLSLLDEAKDPALCFLPFTAGLVPLVMPLLHDARAPQVRDLAAQCLATLIQVAPIERSARIPESVSHPADVQAARSRREAGQYFLDTLLTGATMEKDFAGVLQTAATAGIELRSYQKEGVCWLGFLAEHGLCGALCDDLGLGKTLMALTLVASLPSYTLPECSLVVCPSSLTGHWCQEAQQWYGTLLVPFAYVGSPRERGMELVRLLQFMSDPANASKHALLVISYTVLTRDADRIARMGLSWRTMILDEAHSIRNPYTAASEKCKLIGGAAQHRLAITGTPIHNDVLDLWSVFDFLMPGYLGDASSFERTVAKPVRASRVALSKDGITLDTGAADQGGGGSDDVSRPENLSSRASKREQQREIEGVRAAEALESLRRKILPFLLRREKSSVLRDLPPKIVQDLTMEMSPVQAKVYATLENDQGAGVSDPLGHSMRLLMACTHPLLCLRSLKNATRDRLERRLLESKLSAAQEDGYRTAGKFRALVDLLRNVVIPSADAVGNGGSDARLVAFVKDEADGSSSGVRARESSIPGPNSDSTGPAKAIIFAQWTGTLDLIEEQVLQQALNGALRSLRLDGSVTAHARQSIANRFNTDANIQVLLATTKVGGQGLNLTGANVVIFVEHDWNPMNDLQAMDRAHRLGQRRAVNVYRLLSRGTVEERVLSLQRFKRAVADRVVDADNSAVDSMHTDEILQALNLPQSFASRLDEVHEVDPHETEYNAFDVAAFVRKLDGRQE
ncbi:DNA repair protein, putative [Hondaea fermentalgiana]|uniref:DNA repair protein, putative n=1 Tax=Hondaea fermentalgiana TaxID=2315210 RepID=A0A2R5GDG4_9STRA|nr:DNA repair protein, putative [Hondaea fermentalgiana]|eukprot:GBG26221.1 DNA repair protein, putative [Hondaea fermentalgiana]